MQEMTIQEIATAIGARYEGPHRVVEHISTDSRDLLGKSLFVALKGEQVDGHDYIPKALENPEVFAVAHRKIENDRGRVLYVKDTFPVLMDIARHYRRRFVLHTVGVTGSVGKTTTKDFIAAVLGAKYHTLKSLGNHNNEIGLPKTILELDDSYEAAVLEMGMSALGDIRLLTRIVEPEVGVITNIGVSHLEMLGSRENILRAKLEIREGMADGSPLILCGDNDLLCTVKDNRLRLLRYGIENPRCDFLAKDMEESATGTQFVAVWKDGETPVAIPTIGRHNVYNALAAFAVGVCLEVPISAIVEALARYTPSGMRQRMVEHGGYTVVEDCYNASPDSMQAALSTLQSYPLAKRRICVFADMLELGELSQEAHRRVGALAAAAGVDLLFAYGSAARFYVEGAKSGGLKNARHYPSKETLAQALICELRPGDIVWIKGSRGMALEELLPRIYSA